MLSNFDPATKTMVIAKDGSLQDRSTRQSGSRTTSVRASASPIRSTPRTVLRAGWGVSYVHFHRAGGGNVLPINGPQVINAVVVQTATQSDFRTTQQGYPAGLTDPSQFNPLVANITYMPSDYRSSDVQSWFASVQRELWDGALLDVAYVGNRADGLLLFANYNQAAPNNAAGTLTLQQRRPIPEYADITYSFNGGKSRYNSFQTKFDWRIGRDMTILSSLTLSQDEGQRRGLARERQRQFPGAAGLQQPRRRLSDCRRITSRTTARRASSIDLPFGRGRRYMTDANAVTEALLGGWHARRHQHRDSRRTGDADLHADGGAAGVGHSAGLPRRQQLSPERQRRPAGAGRRAHHQQLAEPHHGDDADRSQPAVRQRAAQQRARSADVDGRHGAVEAVHMPWKNGNVRVPRRVLQPAEPRRTSARRTAIAARAPTARSRRPTTRESSSSGCAPASEGRRSDART